MESKTSHYSTYAQILQTELDEPNELENITIESTESIKLSKSSKSTELEIPEELEAIPIISKST